MMPDVWCPFNSQTTWWFPAACPLMYLPSFCTFRMTGIWRSFVAQRCLWAMGSALTFHQAEVIQQRNVHNLLKDFEDEVPGYLRNESICEILENVKLKPGREAVGGNLLRCYISEPSCAASACGAAKNGECPVGSVRTVPQGEAATICSWTNRGSATSREQ